MIMGFVEYQETGKAQLIFTNLMSSGTQQNQDLEFISFKKDPRKHAKIK